MSKAGIRHFDELGTHTQLKHLILGRYIEAWVRKLLLRDGAGDKVLLIDACRRTRSYAEAPP